MLPEAVVAVVATHPETLTGDLPHPRETMMTDEVEEDTVVEVDTAVAADTAVDKTLVATLLDEMIMEDGTLVGMAAGTSLEGMTLEGTSPEGTIIDEMIDLLDETMTETGLLLEGLSESDTTIDKTEVRIGDKTEVQIEGKIDQSDRPPLRLRLMRLGESGAFLVAGSHS